LWVCLGRLITGDDWAPALVCFAHETPNDTTEHQRIFRAPIRFSSGLPTWLRRVELVFTSVQALDRESAGRVSGRDACHFSQPFPPEQLLKAISFPNAEKLSKNGARTFESAMWSGKSTPPQKKHEHSCPRAGAD
jgi:hypothetical protein